MIRSTLAPMVRSLVRRAGFDLVRTRARFHINQNMFETAHPRRVLLSTIFSEVSAADLEWYTHTCRGENWLLAKSFDDLGFQVDLVQRDAAVPMSTLQEYDVVMGAGAIVNRLVKATEEVAPTVIAYGTGSHPMWEADRTMRRLRDAWAEKGVLFKGSSRMQDRWTPAVPTFADAIVVTGNDFVARTYDPFTTSPVYPVRLYGPRVHAAGLGDKDFEGARRRFLWFGGHSLVHKGLDLALDYFLDHPEYELHIGGRIEREPEFAAYYLPRIAAAPNVHYHGFMALDGDRFREVLAQTGFILVPSCSESTCASVLVCMINGGLIPVVTPETGVDVDGFGLEIDGLTVDAVGAAVERAGALSAGEVRRRSAYIVEEEVRRYTPERFHERLRAALEEIVSAPRPAPGDTPLPENGAEAGTRPQVVPD